MPAFKDKSQGRLFSYHRGEYFLNRVESHQEWIVFALFRLVWHQMGFRLVPNPSEKCNYNQNFVWFNKVQKLICLYVPDEKYNQCQSSCNVVKWSQNKLGRGEWAERCWTYWNFHQLHNSVLPEDPLNPLDTIKLWCLSGFRRATNGAPMMPRNDNPSDGCVPDSCNNPSLSNNFIYDFWRRIICYVNVHLQFSV